jgi:hypothetical protein
VKITLQDLINAAQNAPEGTSSADAVAALLAENSAEVDVVALRDEAIAKFNELQDGADASEETTAALESLAEVVVGARAEEARVEGESAARAERLAALSAKVNGDPAEGEGGEGGEGDGGTEGEGEGEGAGTEGEGEGAPTEENSAAGAPAGEPALVAGAARRTRRQVDLSQLARRQPPKVEEKAAGYSIRASADVPGYSNGQTLDMQGLVAAANARFGGFPTEAVEGLHLRQGIASVKINFPESLVASGRQDDQEVIDFAASQDRLADGEGLVAAGGWCSPSETLYELAGELESADAGILDIPDIQMARGGIRYTEGPDFAALYGEANLTFQQTEAQAIAGATKPVYSVPCTDFTDVRAGVIGLGIKSSILQNDAYPELGERIVRGALAAHAHRYNAETIKRMVTASTAVTANVGASAATSLLNTVELLIVDYRYRYRAPESLLLEVPIPIYGKAMIRSDLALRSGVAFGQVKDEQITSWFADRGARVQWVYDWQDAFTGVTGGFGSATAAVAWPEEIKFMVYAAGTFVRGRGEVITMEGVYDSTLLLENEFLRLFTEEKIAVVRRQYKSLVVTVGGLGVNGVTSAPVELDLQGNPIPATP